MKKWNRIIVCSYILVLCISVALIGFQMHGQQETVEAASFVSWGSSGSQVRQVQQALKNRGYYAGNIDGVFGTGTYNAILNFQKDNGLTADGIAGQATLTALGLSSGGNSALDEDVFILASAIHGEARGEPYEGQVAVGAVILNRVESPQFPNSIPSVVYQRGAFDAVADGQISLTPNETAIRAAKDAINGWDPTEGAIYYWNPITATSRWIWTVPITKSIGRHVFGVK